MGDVPGDIPALSQGPPQLVLPWSRLLVQKLQRRLCHHGGDHPGGDAWGVLWDHLQEEDEEEEED